MLPGWETDDHAAALAAFFVGREAPAEARAWLERSFVPGAPMETHFTAYYEPELEARIYPEGRFDAPLHRLPEPLVTEPRREIRARNLLAGHEIAYVEGALEAFLAEVQGSVRLRLPSGVLRLGYAGKNGQPYRSIGKELAARGVEGPVSVDVIRHWAMAHPEELDALLDLNDSKVYFKLLDLPPELGPIGTLGVPLTPMRSVAVDPEVISLGTPVWVELPGDDPIRGLFIAQDTGGAIKGARADLFLGWGREAGLRAGRVNSMGCLTPLVPR